MPMYFEDFAIGDVARFGRYEVTREEVIAFAGRYDPQPFHLDEAAAAANPIFGRIAASGWHTGAMTMRMTVEDWQARGFAGIGSPGVDELRWLKPVYPGDTLRVESEVLDARASQSRPDRGTLRVQTTTVNQHDEPVMRFVATVFVRRRPV